MRIASVVLIAGIVAAWFVFRVPGDDGLSVPEADRAVGAASATQPVDQSFELPGAEVEPEPGEGTQPDVSDAVESDSRNKGEPVLN